jgi:hypothetical protein
MPAGAAFGTYRMPSRSISRAFEDAWYGMWGSGSTVLEFDGDSDSWGGRGGANGRGASECPMWRGRGHCAATVSSLVSGMTSVAKRSS